VDSIGKNPAVAGISTVVSVDTVSINSVVEVEVVVTVAITSSVVVPVDVDVSAVETDVVVSVVVVVSASGVMVLINVLVTVHDAVFVVYRVVGDFFALISCSILWLFR
jgi:hypothetical protein